ncbi:MAG: hypothetical protein L6Q40_01195 [Azonexus sp.]|nr:hypothetical protein [Azonexus sp.]
MNGKDRFSIPIRPAMAPFGIALSLLLSACANVAFDPGSTRLEEKALVFGRIQLDLDGETSIISVLSSPVVIRDIETGKEPGLITQAFEKDGRFHWALPPGRYQLSMVLHRYTDGVQSYSFNLDKAGTAYYFGDLTLHGKGALTPWAVPISARSGRNSRIVSGKIRTNSFDETPN